MAAIIQLQHCFMNLLHPGTQANKVIFVSGEFYLFIYFLSEGRKEIA